MTDSDNTSSDSDNGDTQCRDNDGDISTIDKKTLKAIRKAAKEEKKKYDKEERQRQRQGKKDKRQERRDMIVSVAVDNRSALARAALLATLVVVATVNAVLSSVGLYGYGRVVQDLPMWLAPLVPIGIEGLTIGTIAAIYMLRHDPLRVRLYAWGVFGAAVATSVFGNIARATHDADLKADGVVGSASPSILLTLTVHLVVVVMRRVELASAVATKIRQRAAAKAVVDAATSGATPVATTDVAVGATDATSIPRQQGDNLLSQDVSQLPVAPTRQTSPERRYAEARAAEGASVADIHQELSDKKYDTSRRNVERWTKPIRDAMQDA